MPTTSSNPEAEHKRFWSVKLTRPIDDPFWNKHRPGDRWNCKCSLEATDEPITPIPDDADDEKPQRGLKGNPAKTGQIFDKSHPYFPKNCASCGFNRKKGTITSRLRGWFNAGNKPCESCTYYLEATDALRREASQWKDIPPPKADTYISLHDGKVFASPYHGENEWAANEEMAKFLADKLGKKVYMLPRLDPSNQTHELLRKKLLPPGVPDGKSPDYLIGGKLFDAKGLFNVERKEGGYQNTILNHLKKAKKQAPNIILDIPDFINLNEAGKAISDFLRQSKHDRVVLVRRKGKLYMYKKRHQKFEAFLGRFKPPLFT